MENLTFRLHDIIIQEINHNTEDKHIISIYKQRFENLRMRNFSDNYIPSPRARRWAPIEPVGALFGDLFGLATTETANRLKDKIN